MLKTLPELVAEARAQLRCVDTATAMDEIRGNNGTIVDVREMVEVEHLTAPHSINVPRGVLEMKITEHTQDPSTPICVHCASGARATLAAEQLMRFGFTNVRAINSGIDEILSVIGS